jgi:hypothetical protein
MAKRDEIQKIQGAALARPSFIQVPESGTAPGTELLKDYVIVPRAKIVQKQSSAILQSQFKPGDLIISPINLGIARINVVPGQVASAGPPTLFVPLFFFPDWKTWNPIGLQNEPAIAYSTNDPTDPIVAKSRSKDLRMEQMLGSDNKPMLDAMKKPMMRRHVEHLNFICMPVDHELTEPFVMSFSRSGHFDGAKFSGLIRQRRAALYACVFSMRTTIRSKNGNDWYGLEVSNPPQEGEGARSQWIEDEKEFRAYEELYQGFKKKHGTHGLKADMTDAEDERPGVEDFDASEPVGERVM